MTLKSFSKPKESQFEAVSHWGLFLTLAGTLTRYLTAKCAEVSPFNKVTCGTLPRQWQSDLRTTLWLSLSTTTRVLIWPLWERPVLIPNLTLPWSNLTAWEHFKRIMAIYFQIQVCKACGIIPKDTAKGALASYGVKSEYLGHFKNLVPPPSKY